MSEEITRTADESNQEASLLEWLDGVATAFEVDHYSKAFDHSIFRAAYDRIDDLERRLKVYEEEAFSVLRKQQEPLADAWDWGYVHAALKECKKRLEDGGVRHSWLDPALDIAASHRTKETT